VEFVQKRLSALSKSLGDKSFLDGDQESGTTGIHTRGAGIKPVSTARDDASRFVSAQWSN
jgi:hypothetical protein